jgi:hypothetical protein
MQGPRTIPRRIEHFEIEASPRSALHRYDSTPIDDDG